MKPQADWRMLGHVAANGSSEMVNNLSTSVTTLLFNIILMRLIGQDGVAAIGILLYLDFILIAVSLGYSIGAAPLFSYNYGSGDQRKLKELFRQSTLLSAGIGLFMTAATILSAGPLIRIFTPEGSSVYELAVGGLRIYAVSYLFKGYNIFSSAMFTAFGDGKVSAFLSILRTLVFLTAAIVIFAVLFGIKGVWAASPAAEALAFAAALAFTIKCGRKYHYLG